MEIEPNYEVESTSNYNELYSQPHDDLCKTLKKYIEMGGRVQFGSYQEVTGKLLYPLLIKKCLQLFDQYKCNGCSGSHQYVIAGGYASYLADLTKAFNDIDIYIHCTDRIDQQTKNMKGCTMKTHRNVSTFSFNLKEHKPHVQFIQVNFDIGVTKTQGQSKVFQELMTIYVLTKFDLPICRVAVRIPLNLELKMIYITNASCFDMYKLPSKEGRREKYEARRNNNSRVIVP